MLIQFDPSSPSDVAAAKAVIAALSGTALTLPPDPAPPGTVLDDGALAPPAPAAAATEKRSRGRPKKDAPAATAPEAPAAPAAAAPYAPAQPGAVANGGAVAAAPPPDFADLDFGDGDKKITKEQVITAVRDFYARHGKDETQKLLGRFSVSKVNDIKAEDFSTILKACEA